MNMGSEFNHPPPVPRVAGSVAHKNKNKLQTTLLPCDNNAKAIQAFAGASRFESHS